MISFVCKTFDQLTPYELYDILQLRQEVFVVEQNCPYLDADGKDHASLHLMGCDPVGRLCCYTRLLPSGVSYPDYPSIGRVVSTSSVRGSGAGKLLMQQSIAECRRLFGNTPSRSALRPICCVFTKTSAFAPQAKSIWRMVFRTQK